MRAAAAQLLTVKKRAEAGLCPVFAQLVDKPHPCHSEFVGADDSVRLRTLAWESVPPQKGERIAASLRSSQ